MNRYITFDVKTAGVISLKADANNTPIRIVRGGVNTEDIILNANWMSIYYSENDETITIYGDICGFSNEYGGISAIDVINNTGLTELTCNRTYELTSLDVSTLVNLKILECWGNKLTSLVIGNLTNLTNLDCYDNQLTVLSVFGLTNLETLNCCNNQIATLEIDGLINLERLYCDDNQISTLNVANLDDLKYLHCNNNQLTSLNVTNFVEFGKFTLWW